MAAGRRARRRRIERLSIALLVASSVFQLATGVANAQYWYPFKFNFVVAHYYGAIIFVSALAIHVIAKTPVILRAYRERGWLKPLRDDLAHTQPEPGDAHGGLVTTNPAEPTISRRGLLAFAGAGALTAAGGQRRAVDRRPVPQARVPRAAPGRRLPGQQDGGLGRDHARDDRRRATSSCCAPATR